MPSNKSVRQPHLGGFFWPSLGPNSLTARPVEEVPQKPLGATLVNGHSIDLTKDELIVLRRLVQASGKPVENDTLRSCLGQGHASLRKVIASLRLKLAPCQRIRITLVFGTGYSVVGVDNFTESKS